MAQQDKTTQAAGSSYPTRNVPEWDGIPRLSAFVASVSDSVREKAPQAAGSGQPSESPKLIHIIGVQGCGKSLLTMQIIAGLKGQKKTARAPQHESFYNAKQVATIAKTRLAPREPFTQDTSQPNVLILEHEDAPKWLSATIKKGDQVITISSDLKGGK